MIFSHRQRKEKLVLPPDLVVSGCESVRRSVRFCGRVGGGSGDTYVVVN